MIRLLVIGDHACQTGFGRVVKGICDTLDATGEYDIRVRAINYQPDMAHGYPYEIRPVTTDVVTDPLGISDFDAHLRQVEPDVLLTVQDLWHLTSYMARKPRALPAVGYFPVDTPNMKWSYAMGLGAMAEPVAYTKFGAREAAASVREALDIVGSKLQPPAGETGDPRTAWFSIPKDGAELHCRLDRMSRLQNPDNWNVIPHGMDLSMFRPDDRRAAREMFGLPQDAFIVLNVNTNQFRKRLDLTIRAFAGLRQRVANSVLVIHCMGGANMGGWDLSQLARYYGVHDRILLVHQQLPVLSDVQLRMLYNTADVQINTSGGEGWGLTSFEGAACGIPQLVPDWSATRELWAGAAGLLPVADWRHEPKSLNTAHALINVRTAVDWLALLAEDPVERLRMAEDCHLRAAAQKSWDEVGMAFDRVIKRALSEGRGVGMTMDEVRRERSGECLSELAQRPY